MYLLDPWQCTPYFYGWLSHSWGHQAERVTRIFSDPLFCLKKAIFYLVALETVGMNCGFMLKCGVTTQWSVYARFADSVFYPTDVLFSIELPLAVAYTLEGTFLKLSGLEEEQTAALMHYFKQRGLRPSQYAGYTEWRKLPDRISPLYGFSYDTAEYILAVGWSRYLHARVQEAMISNSDYASETQKESQYVLALTGRFSGRWLTRQWEMLQRSKQLSLSLSYGSASSL